MIQKGLSAILQFLWDNFVRAALTPLRRRRALRQTKSALRRHERPFESGTLAVVSPRGGCAGVFAQRRACQHKFGDNP